MSKYFTVSELCGSQVARQLNITNTPTEGIVRRLEILMERLLDPARELWGAPVRVTSGYRCKELNSAVGGAANSQHLRGEAADITTGTREGNRRLMRQILNSDLVFDQLIDESDCLWLHLSYSPSCNRRQKLEIMN